MALSKIKTGSLAADAVTSAAIADGAIVIADLADGSITSPKLATQTGNVTFADNAKVIFGDGGDLQIVHNGSYSSIRDVGTGSLFIGADDYVSIDNAGLSSSRAKFYDNTVQLYAGGTKKFETTSTGIDVTGTVTADALTVDGYGQIRGVLPYFYLVETDTTDLNTGFRGGDGQFQIRTFGDNLSTSTIRFALNHSSGDISFYDDAGTSQDFYWDASTSRLGLGVTAPSAPLQVETSSGNALRITRSGVDSQYIEINETDGSKHRIRGVSGTAKDFDITNSFGKIVFRTSSSQGGDSEAARIDSSGRVGIGTTAPAGKLDVLVGGDERLIFSTLGTDPSISAVNAANNAYTSLQLVGSDVRFFEGGSERMRIDSSGNVGIGTTSPAALLDVADGNIRLTSNSGSGSYHDFAYGGTNGENFFINADRGSTGSGNMIFRVGGTSEKMRIDSSGRVGIGTSSPSEPLHISSTAPVIQLTDTNTGADHYISGSSGVGSLFINADVNSEGSNPALVFMVQNDPKARIDSSGRLLIGASSTIANSNANELELTNPSGSGVVGMTFNVNSGSANTGNIYWRSIASNNAIQISGDPISNYLAFATSGTEAARIDSSGNLLVGTTTDSGNGGVSLGGSGQIYASRAGTVQYLNRESTDGTILQFNKDGSSVGSIGTNGGRPYFTNPTYGGLKVGTGYSVDPANNSTGAGWDNALDLGAGGTRWKDLYLSGGVYLGGTGAANYLDDYEEGYYQPTMTATGGGTINIGASEQDIKYTKIGRLVYLSGRIKISSVSSPSGELRISLPFAIETGTDQSGFSAFPMFTHGVNLDSGTISLFGEASPVNSYMTVFQMKDAAAWTALSAANLTGSGNEYFFFNSYYPTAS